MEDDDYALAVALQNAFYDDLPNIGKKKANCSDETFKSKKSLVDPDWELIDPNPDIFVLFQQFDKAYFWNALSMVEVKWSSRMTLCAGLCCYEGHGMLCSIRLSQPLLKLRPRKDLVETLLHEMIHAYLFVTANNKDRDGHGPEFCKHMHRINAAAGTNITIYHTFHNEVDEMRKHWWRCTGPCCNRPPYFGYVKRAMNRQPSQNDYWWNDHQRSCGGTYIKIKEPENYGKKTAKSTQKKSSGETCSIPSSTQRTLNFNSGKQLKEKHGNVLGGAPLPNNSNPRGIPLYSRLLSSLNHSVSSSQNRGENVLRKIRSNGVSPKIRKRISVHRKKSENLTKICQEMRRTGSRSVNENAAAYSVYKIKTRFSSSGGKDGIIFDSDDELSSDTDSGSTLSQAKKNISTSKNSISTTPKLNAGPHNDIRVFLSPSREKNDFGVGTKRKYTPTVEAPKPLNFRSPLKKKPNFDSVKVSKTEDVPSTSKSTFVKYDSSLSLSEEENTTTPYLINKSLEPSNVSDLNENASSLLDVPTSSQNTESAFSLPAKVACPVCTELVSSNDINMHIDICLSLKAIQDSSF